MHTIYGGKTLNGIEVEDMVNNSEDYVTFKEGTEFFARVTMLGFTNKPDDQRKPGVALFYNNRHMNFTPLFALKAEEDEEDYGPLIKQLFGLANAAGIYDYTPAELEAMTELVQKLDGIEFKDCDATDSDGHTTEGMVEYEGEEYYVYSSAYCPLSFEAECARDILQEKERKTWLKIYATFNDDNEHHADLAFISNGLNVASFGEIHKANLDFLKEVAEHLHDSAPFPEIRKVSHEFDAYLDEMAEKEGNQT